jgi:hypothetical protein
LETKYQNILNFYLLLWKIGQEPIQGRILFEEIHNVFIFSLQPELRIDFENAVSGLKISNTNVIAVKKLSTMTPLQILCSFQTWNAKNVSDSVHKCLEKLVSTLLDKG